MSRQFRDPDRSVDALQLVDDARGGALQHVFLNSRCRSPVVEAFLWARWSDVSLVSFWAVSFLSFFSGLTISVRVSLIAFPRQASQK